MGVAFGFFTYDTDGCCFLLRNATKRRVNFCVDGLSSRNFRALKLDLTKKLAEMGNAPYVKAALDALQQMTVQHEYLHETRMH